MYKARHIGKIAGQSGPQLLRADTLHEQKNEKKYRNDRVSKKSGRLIDEKYDKDKNGRKLLLTNRSIKVRLV